MQAHFVLVVYSYYLLGVLNVLEGSDGEIELSRGMTELDIISTIGGNARRASSPPPESPEATSSTPIIGHPAVVEPEETLILPYYEQPQKNLIAPAASVAGVDPAHREKSLSDQDFYTVFKMTKTDFVQLPAWKRSSLKKKYGLF